MNRIEEGTYGVVYRAKDKKTGKIFSDRCLFSASENVFRINKHVLIADEIVALKRLKMEKEKEGFPITSLREINTILKAQHPNIVTVRVRSVFMGADYRSLPCVKLSFLRPHQEIVVGSNMDKIYIVMNYVEHDLKSLMETMKQPFLPGGVT